MSAAEWEIVRLTLLVGGVATAATLPVAFGLAWVLARGRFPVKLLLDAAAKAGSAEGSAVIGQLEGLKYTGLTGEEEIRAADHQVIKDYYLLKGKTKDAMAGKDDYVDIISAGKSFLSAEQSGCKMTA